ncbi:hypothetical protein BKA69DRAFT_1101763 [Paraphysoderma sedebokerense]|nr:hypothetical protein BKA69DRAFT_1101763 [Paraphysoderma sedebokerense]
MNPKSILLLICLILALALTSSAAPVISTNEAEVSNLESKSHSTDSTGLFADVHSEDDDSENTGIFQDSGNQSNADAEAEAEDEGTMVANFIG